MVKDELTQLTVKQLVGEFKKNQEKGEFRNKLGRVWWPIWNRFIVPGAALCGILSGAVGGIIGGAALWALGHQVTKSFAINVQNIAIRNAGIFGYSMKKRHVPEEIRRQAILEYLRQSGSWFINRSYVKDNPQEIDRMVDGKAVDGINNLGARIEGEVTHLVNNNQKRGRSTTWGDRLEAYRRAINGYREEEKRLKRRHAPVNKRALPEMVRGQRR